MCFLRMLMISPIKGHGLVTHESALACRHDFFGLLSILKQCLNQLPTSRNQETPFKKKKLQIFNFFWKIGKCGWLCNPALSKGKLSSRGPMGGEWLSCVLQPLSLLTGPISQLHSLAVAAWPLGQLHSQFLPSIHSPPSSKRVIINSKTQSRTSSQNTVFLPA